MTEQKTVEVVIDEAREIIARRGKKIFLKETIHSLTNEDEWELVGNIDLIMENLEPLIAEHGRNLRIVIKLKDGNKFCYRGNGSCSNLLGPQYKNYDRNFSNLLKLKNNLNLSMMKSLEKEFNKRDV